MSELPKLGHPVYKNTIQNVYEVLRHNVKNRLSFEFGIQSQYVI